jgi:hypothetical protein
LVCHGGFTFGRSVALERRATVAVHDSSVRFGKAPDLASRPHKGLCWSMNRQAFVALLGGVSNGGIRSSGGESY